MIVQRIKNVFKSLIGEIRYERLMVARRAAAAARASELEQRAHRANTHWDLGEPAKAVEEWKALEAAQPLEAEWPIKLARAADMRADHLEAERIVGKAWSRGLRGKDLEERVLFYKRWNRNSNTAAEDAVAVVRDPEASSLMIFKAVGYLLAENMLEPAREGLARIADLSEFQGTGKTLATALEILEEARAAGRTPISGWLSPARDAILAREPGADTTVICFTTLLGDIGPPVNALHALLQPLKVNGIYLFDEKRLFNLGGSTTFGRPYSAMLEGLRAQLDAWGTRTLIMIGFSGAGFPALRVGLDLKADGAFLIAPVITLYRGPEFPLDFISETNDRRMAYLEKHMRENVPDIMTNLSEEFEGRAALPLIEIHRGVNFADMVHTAFAEGKPGVEIHELAGFKRHECLTEIIRRGDKDVLTRFVSRVRGMRRREMA